MSDRYGARAVNIKLWHGVASGQRWNVAGQLVVFECGKIDLVAYGLTG